MLRIAAKIAKKVSFGHGSSTISPTTPLLPIRFLTGSDQRSSFTASPVAVQMINYGLSLARAQKSDESYAQGLLVLEQCQSTQSDENSKGMVLLAMSSLLYERGNVDEAIEKLQKISDLNIPSIAVRVAASEALIALHLELGQDDASLALANLCLQLLGTIKVEIGDANGLLNLEARMKALKGLVELISGKSIPVDAYFEGAEEDNSSLGRVALSYAEFLHSMGKYTSAKELYEKVINGIPENKNFFDAHNLSACNTTSEEVLLAATCALGQLEGHLGNFGDAEELLTAGLKKAEEHFGSHHPKVGVILTCVALMYRHKAFAESSSSLLIQEGLYRRALELLKAPPLDTQGHESKVYRQDIMALARGGYADTLCVQQNRKLEGEKMKHWAETAWTNCRLSLAEALELSESPSKVPVIESRISRVL